MKTVTISFAVEPGDNDVERAMQRALNADRAYRALEEIRSQIFRPASKYGYEDKTIAKLASDIDNACGNPLSSPSSDLIAELARLYFQILEDNSIDMEREGE